MILVNEILTVDDQKGNCQRIFRLIYMLAGSVLKKRDSDVTMSTTKSVPFDLDLIDWYHSAASAGFARTAGAPISFCCRSHPPIFVANSFDGRNPKCDHSTSRSACSKFSSHQGVRSRVGMMAPIA